MLFLQFEMILQLKMAKNRFLKKNSTFFSQAPQDLPIQLKRHKKS